MREQRRNAVCAAALSGVLLLSASARAGDVPREYRKLADEGMAEFNRGNAREALALLARAYEIYPSARALRAIAKCHFELKHYTQAIKSLDQALASQTDALPKELLEDARALRERSLGFTAVVNLRVTPPASAVFIDGSEATSGARFDIGEHEARASYAGYDDLRTRFELSSPEPYDLRLTLVQANATGAKDSTAEGATQARPFPWLAVGLVAGSLTVAGVGAGYYFERSSELEDCRAAIEAGARCGNEDTLKGQRALGSGLFILGAVGTVGSLIFLGHEMRAPKRTHVAVVPQTGGMTLSFSGTFQ